MVFNQVWGFETRVKFKLSNDQNGISVVESNLLDLYFMKPGTFVRRRISRPGTDNIVIGFTFFLFLLYRQTNSTLSQRGL